MCKDVLYHILEGQTRNYKVSRKLAPQKLKIFKKKLFWPNFHPNYLNNEKRYENSDSIFRKLGLLPTK